MKSEEKTFEYDDKYFNCLEDNWSVVSYPKISTLLEKGLSLAESRLKISTTLDLGCGNGIYCNILKKHSAQVYGIDISEVAVNHCIAKKIYTKVLQENISEGLSFPSDYFDVIFSTEVIEHIEDLDILFKELKRILKKSGVLMLTTTMYFNSINSYSKEELGHSFFQVIKVKLNYLLGFISKSRQKKFVLDHCFEKLGGHHHGFHKRDLEEVLNRNGFKIISYNYFYPFNPIRVPFYFTDLKSLLKKQFPKNIIGVIILAIVLLLNKIFIFLNLGANNIFITAQQKP